MKPAPTQCVATLAFRARGRALSAALVVLAAASGAAAQSIPLYPGPQHAAGNWPSELVAVDLDEDGRLDLAVCARISSDVSVLCGNGYGRFGEPTSFPVGLSPEAVATGDVDGDGHADLVSADNNGHTVTLLRGDGLGGLLSSVAYPVGQGPASVAMGDLDGDGLDDVVSADNEWDTVSVLLADGAGGLLPAVALPTPGHPIDVRLHDLDGDGRLDLLTANAAAETVGVRLGDGLGGFGPHAAYPVGDAPGALDVADLDGDGDADVVTANSTFVQQHLSVLLGDGAGGLSAPTLHTVPGINAVLDVALGDVTGDGLVDAVSIEGGFTKGAFVSPGDGAGGFLPATRLEVGAVSLAVILADVDGDCIRDIVTADAYGDSVTVLLGDGAGGLVAERSHPLPSVPVASAVADLDGDGAQDVVTAQITSLQGVAVSLGDGAGGLLPAVMHPIVGPPNGLALGDVTGDGELDAVCVRLLGQEVILLAGDGAGGFGPAQTTPIGSLPWAVAAGDLDGDGDDDLVVTSMKAGAGNVSVLLADGTGGFGHQIDHPVAGFEAQDVQLADLDADRDLDVVTADGGSNTLTVLLGDGVGNLTVFATLATAFRPESVALGDLDEDGHVDIVAANDESGDLRLFFGDGLGGFVGSPLPALPVGWACAEVTIADVDDDGHLDLVAAATFISDSRACLYLGKGDGTFVRPPALFGTGGSPLAIEVVDLDGDGRPEIVTANSSSNSLSILAARLPPANDPWMDYGCSLAGAGGVPALDGSGDLEPGSPGSLDVSGAAALADAALFLALNGVPVPFKGGVLRAFPPLLVVPLVTDGAGAIALPFVWPGGVPAGLVLTFQCGVLDAGAVAGVALSNALCAATP